MMRPLPPKPASKPTINPSSSASSPNNRPRPAAEEAGSASRKKACAQTDYWESRNALSYRVYGDYGVDGAKDENRSNENDVPGRSPLEVAFLLY